MSAMRNTARQADVMHGHGVPSADLAAASRGRTSGMPVASLLQDAAARFPNKPGIVANGKALSYLELDLEAQRIALRLIAAGRPRRPAHAQQRPPRDRLLRLLLRRRDRGPGQHAHEGAGDRVP